ncbi:MAG: multicopper oxidase family protein [Acidobacteriaceae bacterium]|nr:multicopper oxidase family protein [Acidobacteriaceae bacterium]
MPKPSRRQFLMRSAQMIGGITSSRFMTAGGLNREYAPLPAERSDRYTLTASFSDRVLAGYPIRTRTYNGSFPGPLIVTRPGHALRVLVKNELPPDPVIKPPAGIDPDNNPHVFNTTALHFHGLQVKPHLFGPLGTSDPSARMVAIKSGESLVYDLQLPDDHPSGLYWYHPHHHGSATVQVAGGMAGIILVKGAIDEVPEIAAARDAILVVQNPKVNPNQGGAGRWGWDPVPYKAPDEGGFSFQTALEFLTVNGKPVLVIDRRKPIPRASQLSLPVYRMRPGEVMRLRVLNGTDGIPMQLLLPDFETYLIAQDGINLLKPEEACSSEKSASRLAPGNRLEFLIRAPERPVRSTLTAIAHSSPMTGSMPQMMLSESMGEMMDHPAMGLAQFIVGDTGSGKMAIPSSLPTPLREYPLIDDSEILARRTIVLSMKKTNRRILTGYEFLIDNRLYEETRIDANPRLGTAEEWTIDNQSDGIHPFHVHVNSFEVVSAPWDETYHRLHDTIWVPPFSKVKLRMRFKTWKGKSVYHCHVLPHEDTAMIQNFLVS